MGVLMKPLTVAINKGRILEEVLPVLRRAGVAPIEDIHRSRKLIFETTDACVRLVIMRGTDVPTYVEYGAADMGVVGKDTLLEYPGQGYYERLDLGIAPCRLMTAAPAQAMRVDGTLRIATKFVRTAKRFFAERHRQVDIIKLSGALEIAPQMGLADQIVDIVDSGNTLKANGLVALETIAEITSRVIVNRASMKVRLQEIEGILRRLSDAADDINRGGVGEQKK